jgi:hypothetical protein
VFALREVAVTAAIVRQEQVRDEVIAGLSSRHDGGNNRDVVKETVSAEMTCGAALAMMMNSALLCVEMR